VQHNKIDQNTNKTNTAPCLHFIGNFTHVTGMSKQIAHIRFNFRLCNGRFWRVLSFTLSVSSFRVDAFACQRGIYRTSAT